MPSELSRNYSRIISHRGAENPERRLQRPSRCSRYSWCLGGPKPFDCRQTCPRCQCARFYNLARLFEFVPVETFHTWLDDQIRLPPPFAAQLALEHAEALVDYVH